MYGYFISLVIVSRFYLLSQGKKRFCCGWGCCVFFWHVMCYLGGRQRDAKGTWFKNRWVYKMKMNIYYIAMLGIFCVLFVMGLFTDEVWMFGILLLPFMFVYLVILTFLVIKKYLRCKFLSSQVRYIDNKYYSDDVDRIIKIYESKIKGNGKGDMNNM